jgi:hypothetical protein
MPIGLFPLLSHQDKDIAVASIAHDRRPDQFAGGSDDEASVGDFAIASGKGVGQTESQS